MIVSDRADALEGVRGFEMTTAISKDAANGHGTILSINGNMNLKVLSDGSLKLWLKAGDDGYRIQTEAGLLSTTDWHEVGVRFDGANRELAILVDGEEAATGESPGAMPANIGNHLMVGRAFGGSVAARIDDVVLAVDPGIGVDQFEFAEPHGQHAGMAAAYDDTSLAPILRARSRRHRPRRGRPRRLRCRLRRRRVVHRSPRHCARRLRSGGGRRAPAQGSAGRRRGPGHRGARVPLRREWPAVHAVRPPGRPRGAPRDNRRSALRSGSAPPAVHCSIRAPAPNRNADPGFGWTKVGVTAAGGGAGAPAGQRSAGEERTSGTLPLQGVKPRGKLQIDGS